MSDQILNRLQRIDDKISKLTERSRKIEDINKNVEAVYEKQQVLSERIEEAMNEVLGLRKKVSFLESENVVMKNEIKALRASMEDSYATSKQCELEISGIPPAPAEDLKGLCIKINDKLSAGIKEKDIIFAQRLSSRGGKVGNIHVRLTGKLMRDKLLTNARKSKLKCYDLGMTGVNNTIFINECLSSYSRTVLYHARQFRVAKNWKFCWVRDGKIFLRKAEKEPAIRISCTSDLLILSD